MSLQLFDILVIGQLGLVNFAKPRVDRLEDKHAEEGLVEPDACQEYTSRESHQAADNRDKLWLGRIIIVDIARVVRLV